MNAATVHVLTVILMVSGMVLVVACALLSILKDLYAPSTRSEEEVSRATTRELIRRAE